jgi:hypothetical protein
MKKVIFKLGIFLYVILSFISCDFFNNIDGLVIDDKTNEPIDSALVYVKFKDKVLDSFSYIEDSLSKIQREAFIKENGNEAKWTDTGFDKMIRNIPTLTDSSGKFEIGFAAGAFPRYKLCFKKPGYETFEIENKQIIWTEQSMASEFLQ